MSISILPRECSTRQAVHALIERMVRDVHVFTIVSDAWRSP
jgi:hypothetical protein